MQILTIAEASDFLKRSEQAIRKLVSRRAIPYRYAGGRKLIFIKEEVEVWLMDSPGLSIEQFRKEKNS